VTSSTDFVNLLVVSPGDLIYYLAVFALSQAAFFMALGVRLRHRENRAPRIYVLATLGVVIAWTLLLVSAIFAIATETPSEAILPPIDRLVHVLVVLFLGWAFITADHERFGRAGNAALLILIGWAAVGYVVTGIEWSSVYQTADFNTFSYGATWTFIPAALCLLGAILCLVYFRIIHDAPLKLVYFGVLLLGYAATLITIGQGTLVGDYAGLPRLAFLASMILALSIVYRMVIVQLDQPHETVSEPTGQPRSTSATASVPFSPAVPVQNQAAPTLVESSPVSERESAQLMKALGIMLEKASPENIPERIVSAALNTLKGDVGVLLSIPEAHYADVIVGVDRVMGRTIKGISINLDEQVTLANAIERRVQRPLYPDRNGEELTDLYARLDIESKGPTYFQPLVSERELLAVLMIGLPYAGRELIDSEQELLKGIGIIAANLLALSYAARNARLQAESRVIEAMAQGVSPEEIEADSALRAWSDMQADLDASRDQIGQLQKQVTTLKIELDDERSRVARSLGDTQESQSISQRIITLNDAHQKLIEERDRLAVRLREAETALAGASGDDTAGMFKALIEALRREKDDLVTQRDRLHIELDEIRQTGGAAPRVIQEMIERMSDEKARVELERDSLNEKLVDIEAQLAALGIQVNSGGLTQMITQIYEQRAVLQARYDDVKHERDMLLSDRAQVDDLIAREGEREKMIQALQTEVAHLASDREAMNKQREKMRLERDELVLRQESMRALQARVLAENAAFEQELTEAHEELNALRGEIQSLANERTHLTQSRDLLLAERQAVETQRDQLMARIEGDRTRLQQLGVDGVGALTRMIEELTAQRADIERELNDTRSRLAAVEDKLQMAEIRAASLQPQVIYRPDNPDALVGMVQELRTPMTSIVGYVDLLLNESAGILGEMQRKFLQRVSANVHRLSAMMEDLIQLSYLDAGKFGLEPQPVDVIELIDDAITSAANPLREKGLTVHLSLDDDAPPVLADRDAMSQIIGQLLTNAYLASPVNSELFISAQIGTYNRQVNGHKEPSSALLVSFEDRGGGILPEDQPRVFARKYKAENPLIQGLGDTGVGLAIAKALIEAQSGEIWVDSTMGVGTAFNFAIPLQAELMLES